jgi:hypothetical protein
MIYGEHRTFSYNSEELKINISEAKEAYIYRRECNNEKVERLISSKSSRVIVAPVEPVNKPAEVTNYLEIDFSRSVFIEPQGRNKVFLKFPIEICVFLSDNKKISVLDVFTLTKPKYTLYGTPRTGIICRWYKSDVYTSIPEIDPLREGVIELEIKNELNEWVEVAKIVFDAYDMKIYYNGGMVSMRGEMRIISKVAAETKFNDEPLMGEQKRSIDLYTAKALPMIERKGFFMEWGLK